MRFPSLSAAAIAATLLLASAAFAHDGVHINDAYARILPGARSGAAFFEVENHRTEDDVLLAASSPVSPRIELHTHIHGSDGTMQMRPIEGGIVIPAQASAWLQRGGDHVMFMGFTTPPKDGETFPLTLTFQRAGEVTIDVTVDNAREPDAMMPPNTHAGAAAHAGDHAATDHGMADPAPHAGQATTPRDGQQSHAAQDGQAAHSGHAAAAMIDQSGMSDAEAIAAVMKAQFDRPEAPLTVDPIVIQGASAVASWAQDGKGGRALLARGAHGWQITLCGGADLLDAAFLAQHGAQDADSLARLFGEAEARLGAGKVALSSSFEGVVLITPAE
jgi:hypothetical protein